MTWVVAGQSPFGYGFIASDVCVTYTDVDGTQQTKNCLRKVYEIIPGLLAGFSGTIPIAFKLLEKLQVWLSANDNLGDGRLNQDWLCKEFPEIARRVFIQEQETGDSCGLLLSGVDPNRSNGLPGQYLPFAIKFHSNNNFVPEASSSLADILSIGSGSAAYQEFIANSANILSLEASAKEEIAMRGGYAKSVGRNMGITVDREPSTGISSHIHIMYTDYRSTMETNNDHKVVVEEDKFHDIEMPPVAHSMSELENIIGIEAVGQSIAEEQFL